MSASHFRLFWHRVLVWSGPVLLALLALYKICEWQSERLWFESLGYGAHFTRLFLWRAGAFLGGFSVFAIWLGLNAHLSWRRAADRAVPLSFFQSDDAARLIPLEDKFHLDHYRRHVTVVVVGFVAYLAGLGTSARYLMFVRAFSTVGSGQRDSASNFDLAFFLFDLPFYHWLSRFLLSAIVTALLLVTAITLYEENLGAPLDAFPRARASRISSTAARHLAILWSCLLLWKGLDSLLTVPLSFVSSGNVAARVFDPVDIRFGWTSAAIFAFSAPLLALLSGLSIARGPRHRTFIAGLIWIIGASSLPYLLPLVTARNPKDASWRAALSRHINSTRRAWQLDATERRGLVVAPQTPFRAASLSLNEQVEVATLSSPLPLWPASSAKRAFNARLSSRGSDFRVSQVFLERRGKTLRYIGVAVPQVPASTANWRVRHERGALSLWMQMEASRTARDGSPIFTPETATSAHLGAALTSVSIDFPSPPTLTASPKPPEIETSGDKEEWLFISTKNEAAQSETEIETENESRDVSLRAWSTRLIVATRFLEPQLLRSALASEEITWHRGAAQRCRALAPFLNWRDEEARPVLIASSTIGESTKNEAARLMWIVPGLVWSDDYPDSATPAATGTAPPGVNYGRHVAVGVVDAQSGRTALYTLDENEPFMALYNRVFPGICAPPTSIPNAIRGVLRPSPALLQAQTLVWARYHHQSSDQESLAWARQDDNYRPLFSGENAASALRPLASQTSGDWKCMAYARPESNVGSGVVPPLISILGADERDYGARGAKVRFVEWKPSTPLVLPQILIEPTRKIGTNNITLPSPLLLALAPRFDAKNAAIGLVASRGEVQPETQPASDAAPKIRLKAEVQISGSEAETAKLKTTRNTANSTFNSRAALLLRVAQRAWRDVQIARKNGDWDGVARAEKRLAEALREEIAPVQTPRATGTRSTARRWPY